MRLKALSKWSLLALALALALTGCIHLPRPVRRPSSSSSHGPFIVRSYLGKCLSYGPPPTSVDGALIGTVAPSAAAAANPPPTVYMYDCNSANNRHLQLHTVSQQIVVEEVNQDHEVLLHAGSKVIGVTGNFLINRAPLELQDLDQSTSGATAQTFALDGDSIILAADQSLVVKVQNARGANLTPVVLADRELNDAEFWTFGTADGSYQKPTNGFVRVPLETDLYTAVSNASKGSVIDIDPAATIDVSSSSQHPAGEHLALWTPGVTIRGGRRGGNPGALLYVCPVPDQDCALTSPVIDIGADYVRVTGLRMRGPSQNKEAESQIVGIRAHDPSPRQGHSKNTIYIDHNELTGWTTAAVEVLNSESTNRADDYTRGWDCSKFQDRRFANIHVVGNFAHDNQRHELGYGVVLGNDGYADILGNTFTANRHAIAGDGTASCGYTAAYNLVTSFAPCYDRHIGCGEEQDFDMHGSDASGNHTGGIGGGRVEIARNTFLGNSRWSFVLRGQSCALDRFVDNIDVNHEADDSVQWYVPQFSPAGIDSVFWPTLLQQCRDELSNPGGVPVEHRFWCGFQASPGADPPLWLDLPIAGQFDQPNPTEQLGVGDFDGDGADDLFLATGAAWYYSPRGQTEWRFLSRKRERREQLLFGDFDGDGRTDVVMKQGHQWLVSWGGLSDWEVLNANDESDDDVSNYYVVHFARGGRTDLFHATGSEWLVSAGGVNFFSKYADSSYRVKDLRFADFDGDGKTDVFGVEAGRWRIVSGGQGYWSDPPLNAQWMTDSADGLVVADFDGDGRPDVARSTNHGPEFSSGGTGPWQPLRSNAGENILIGSAAAIGHFANAPAAVLVWSGRKLAFKSVEGANDNYGCCDLR